MDTAQWPQEIAMKPMEEILVQKGTSSNSYSSKALEKRAISRPEKEAAAAINCPRCNSTNTKFCYYNNYSLSQPRYFCKTCRRYWTEGGSLRNVPVGGGSRKNNKRSHNSSSIIMSKKLPDLVIGPQNPRTMTSTTTTSMHHHEHGQDLNLGFSSPTNNFKTISELIQVPNFDGIINKNNINTTSCSSSSVSALELLTGMTSSSTRGMNMDMNMMMPMPAIPDHHHDHSNSVYSASPAAGVQLMFPMPEFKIPSLNFSLDGMGGSSSSGTYHESSSGRLLFPFEDLKTSTPTATTTNQQNRSDQDGGDTNGYWTGMLGGASW